VRLSRFVSPAPLLFLVSLSAVAKPWNGIIPNTSSEIDVVGKFGEPTRTVTTKDSPKRTLVYSGPKAVKGTRQAQFKLNAEKVVERIDVFPAVSLDVAAIEKSYGSACSATVTDSEKDPCFVPKRSPSNHVYYVYAKLGLAVFFKEDGKSVDYLAFIPGV
jgi:hypothetical protein